MKKQLKAKDKIFEQMGALYTALTSVEIAKRKLSTAYARADKIAHKLNKLENDYIQEFGEYPRFWRNIKE